MSHESNTKDAGLHELATRIVAGERSAVAMALNLAEDRRTEATEQTRRLVQMLGDEERALRIGLTGPPGVGKSTLAGALAHQLGKEERVAIVAVDPSSAQSGGAILGDRVRITRSVDDALFVRSVATGGQLGGLAWSVPAITRILSAAFDVVLVETTGVGQTEVDIRHAVDVVAMLVQPGSGDGLQFVKAGIMEIPDVIIVHKSDRSDAEKAAAELRRGTRLPVHLASAASGAGVKSLALALRAFPQRNAEARRDDDAAWLAAVFRAEYGDIAVRHLGGMGALRDALRASREVDPVRFLGERCLRALASIPCAPALQEEIR